jgi:ABC-type Fe3+/spermidine/putrescine transport system ATPase subunit
LTAIHITHDQEEALSIADRVVVMKAGSFVEVGTPDELYEHPKTIFGANFVGEANFLEGTVLNADGETSTIEWGEGLLLESQNASPGEGERVVAAIRPESVIVQKGNDEEGIRGFVETMDFEGETARYEVKIPGYGLFAVRIPFHRGSRPYDVGDPVVIKAPPNKVLLYPYPKEGLQKELDIESRG